MNTYFKVPVLLSVLLFAACGGGGGGTTAIVPPVVAPPVVVDNSLITSTNQTTYSASTQSEEIAAFNLLNAERARCGFGMLNQNIALDTAAKNHADWQLVNQYASHFEISGSPGFMGMLPSDRMIAAGYAANLSQIVNSTDEYSGMTGSNLKAGFGVAAVRRLLNAPYHLAGLVSGYREIGIAVRNDVDAASTHGPRVITQIDMATKAPAGTQLMSTTDVLTYPCNGSTSIDRQLVNESPNPVPGRDLLASPLGSSIYIGVRDGQTITITSASMVNASTGSVITLRTPVTSANDPNPGYYQSHQAYVSADAPLTANTTYQVTINGTNNGTAFNRTFSFTTGV